MRDAFDDALVTGRCLGDVVVPCGVPVQERIKHVISVERG